VIKTAEPVLHVSRWPQRLAHLSTLTYWWPSIAIDAFSLLRWGLSQSSAQRTMRLLVVQCLVYLVIWTLISMVNSIATAAPPEPAPKRRTVAREGPFRR